MAEKWDVLFVDCFFLALDEIINSLFDSKLFIKLAVSILLPAKLLNSVTSQC